MVHPEGKKKNPVHKPASDRGQGRWQVSELQQHSGNNIRHARKGTGEDEKKEMINTLSASETGTSKRSRNGHYSLGKVDQGQWGG